jgi:hypothetical protein
VKNIEPTPPLDIFGTLETMPCMATAKRTTQCSGSGIPSVSCCPIPTLLAVTTSQSPAPQTPPPKASPQQPDEAKRKSWAEIWAAPLLAFLGGIAVALIGGYFTLAVAGYGKSPAPMPTPTPGPVKIMITNKDKISPDFINQVTIEGKVENLGPGQTVWAFDAERSDMKISAHDGPCPVSAEGTFTCLPIAVGDTKKDINQPFRLFVAVLDDSDIRQQIEMNIEREKDNRYRAMPGVIGHPPGAAEDSVDSIMKG